MTVDCVLPLLLLHCNVRCDQRDDVVAQWDGERW